MNKIKIYLLFLYIVLSLHAQPRYVNSLLASYTDSTTPLTNTSLNNFYGAATLFNFNSDIYSSIIAFQEVNPQPNSTAAAVAVKLFKNINCFLYGFKKGRSAAKVRNPWGFVLLLSLVIEESLIIIYDSSLRLDVYF